MQISRFETQISRFFSIHFPNLKVWGFHRLEGLGVSFVGSHFFNCVDITGLL